MPSTMTNQNDLESQKGKFLEEITTIKSERLRWADHVEGGRKKPLSAKESNTVYLS